MTSIRRTQCLGSQKTRNDGGAGAPSAPRLRAIGLRMRSFRHIYRPTIAYLTGFPACEVRGSYCIRNIYDKPLKELATNTERALKSPVPEVLFAHLHSCRSADDLSEMTLSLYMSCTPGGVLFSYLHPKRTYDARIAPRVLRLIRALQSYDIPLLALLTPYFKMTSLVLQVATFEVECGNDDPRVLQLIQALRAADPSAKTTVNWLKVELMAAFTGIKKPAPPKIRAYKRARRERLPSANPTIASLLGISVPPESWQTDKDLLRDMPMDELLKIADHVIDCAGMQLVPKNPIGKVPEIRTAGVLIVALLHPSRPYDPRILYRLLELIRCLDLDDADDAPRLALETGVQRLLYTLAAFDVEIPRENSRAADLAQRLAAEDPTCVIPAEWFESELAAALPVVGPH